MRFLGLILLLSVAFAGCVRAEQGFSDRNQRYRLQPGDCVDIAYEYTPDYNQSVTVAPDGYVTVRTAGPIKLSGLTLTEATEQIRQKSATRLHDPEVFLTLKDFVKPHFTVTGEVNHPGVIDVHGEVSALTAISQAGGFKDTSNMRQVLLVHKLDSGVAQVRVIDYKKLSSVTGAREDFALASNDILIVPKNRIGAIEPYVRVAAMGLTSLYAISVVK